MILAYCILTDCDKFMPLKILFALNHKLLKQMISNLSLNHKTKQSTHSCSDLFVFFILTISPMNLPFDLALGFGVIQHQFHQQALAITPHKPNNQETDAGSRDFRPFHAGQPFCCGSPYVRLTFTRIAKHIPTRNAVHKGPDTTTRQPGCYL